MAPTRKGDDADALPEPYESIVDTIAAIAPSVGGTNRRAEAELKVRLAMSADKATARLVAATWVLAACTAGLFVATIVLAIITATGGDWP